MRGPTRIKLAALGGVAALALLATAVPVPQPFVLHGAAIHDPNVVCEGVRATRGTTVTFQWTAPGATTFFVVNCSQRDGQVVYMANGTQGAGTFVSRGGVYQFGSSCPGPTACYPANVTGRRTAPLVDAWT